MMVSWPYDDSVLASSQVTVWFPAQFAELRRICLSECGGEAAFCASLSRCHRSVSFLSLPHPLG